MAIDGNGATVRIGTWNTYWRGPSGKIGKIIQRKLKAAKCDVLCVTEGSAGILPDKGYVIDAGPDWGCPKRKGRRKVLLWSKQPWLRQTLARSLHESLKGRLVVGTTEAKGVCLTVIGVCIPWDGSHVHFCKQDHLPWEDHKRWLQAFQKLQGSFPKSRTVVLGDFNQKIPKVGRKVPPVVYNALLQTFDGFEFATTGILPNGLMAIDHIAHTQDLDLPRESIRIWCKYDNGKKLSDHFGVRGVLCVS
ncbi:MAG: endonuclease/exonuclease/phosphatase family protein [Bryobacterales bacterium]|nr:endonuclease/exonuclease/phosphatase family protein [Bryobacterales bacterium]